MGDFDTPIKEALKEESSPLRFKVGEPKSDAPEAPTDVLVETSGQPEQAPTEVSESPPAKPPVDGKEADVPTITKAPPFLLFYLLRGLRFFLSMAAVAGAVVVFSPILAAVNFGMADAVFHSGFWPIFVAGLVVPFTSSFNLGKGTPLGVLKIVDKNGEALSRNQAILRSLVFLLTWFILPMQLIFVAAGSRRLLHDIVSGAYVVAPGEDLKTTFYPAAPRWMAPLLIASVVVVLCMQSNFTSYIQRLESLIVPIVLGPDSKLYLDYLKSKFDPNSAENGSLPLNDTESAKRNLSKLEVMTNLQIKYNRRYNEDTARYLLFTARVAAMAGDKKTAEQYLDTFVSLPYSFQKKVLSFHEEDAFAEYNSSFRLFTANLYRQLGAYKKAINIADQEKKKARSLENYVAFEQCCALLYRIYRTTGESKLAEEQRTDLVKSLKYHALYLQQNSHSNWKEEMEPEVRLLDELDRDDRQ